VLTIPERFHQGFKYFFDLTDKKQDALIKTINDLQMGLSPSKITEEISQKLKLDKSRTEEIVDVLFSLIRAKESFDDDLELFVDRIVDALEGAKIVKAKPKKKLSDLLFKFLNLRGSFYFTFKGIDLSTERQKILSESKIFTDIRPIFGDSKDYNINCSLIIHNLKIEYFEDAKQKNIFFALDSKDLKDLKDIIIRAQEKEKAIEKQYKKSNISFLEISE